MDFVGKSKDGLRCDIITCMRSRIPWQQRFWRFVTPGGPDECWEWQGARNALGYGRLNRGGRNGITIKAHRASWEIYTGEDPGENDICHTCDNPACVNPNHLWAGNAKSNAQDMVNKGRHGNMPGKGAKITDAQIIELRQYAASGTPYEDLANAYGLTLNYVIGIITGYYHLEIDGPLTRRPNGNQKLTDAMVRAIRERASNGVSLKQLATQFDVNISYVSSIIHGHVRANAGGPTRN